MNCAEGVDLQPYCKPRLFGFESGKEHSNKSGWGYTRKASAAIENIQGFKPDPFAYTCGVNISAEVNEVIHDSDF